MEADIVGLNIRGTKIDVLKNTLTRVKGSTFDKILNNKETNLLPIDRESRIFIDMDPNEFNQILKWLDRTEIAMEGLPQQENEYNSFAFYRWIKRLG